MATPPPDTFTALLNPAPPSAPTLPPPVAGKSVNVKPVSGTVRIRRPGSKRFVTLTAEAQIPVGSSIDTRRGRIAITAAQGGGKTASADFYDGLFKLTQAKRSKVTSLTLTERLSCPRKASASAAAKKKKKRRLWGDGSGKFRTKGKHSAATVVGTKWLVEDRCKSTLTRVVRGRVKVRDFAKKKTVTVRAGKRYTARAKRRARAPLDSGTMMRAVDAVMECLKAEGVDVVFGYPGGANLPTYDAFVDAGIRHVLVRHEAGGGHAAEGYAKASGKVGVVFATSGPGATNIVTPLTDAMMDSVPIVAFTGQVRTDLLGTDGFQEADTFGITMPIVKHSFMIQHPTEIPRAVHEAFHLARTGRPGPVLIDMPVDLTRAEIDYQPVGDVRLPGYQPTTEGNSKQIRLAAKAIANARRPVIYAGGGVINADAAEELTEFVISDRLPITCTLMGLGAFPAPHPQWLGMLGMHGTRTANYAMDEADLIVAVGARFDDRITGKLSEFAPRAKFVHIDIDPAEISKNVPAHIPIVGDAKNVLARLINEYRAVGPDPARLAGWWERLEQWQAQYPLQYEDSADGEIKPQYLVQALYEATGGDCILSSDVGQHQMWAAQYFHFSKPRRWVNSGGLGTMGFGLPAAMGAAVGNDSVPSVLLTGDGSFQMNTQELATCREHDIPVKVVIMNNGYLGMVRQWQELFWDGRYSNVDMGSWPDWVKLAEAYGATGVRLTDKTTLVKDLQVALETPGPVVVDVRVTREENTYPMIPAGSAAREMVG